MKKFKKFTKWLIVLLLVLVVTGIIAFKIYTTNYYRADLSIIENIEEVLSGKVHSYSDKNGTVFIPEKQEIKAVIVFYPGGKVEYSSYNGLMYELASRGYLCLLTRMPENLAVLKINAVDTLTASYPDFTAKVADVDWYIAGHSLGGVAACAHIGNNNTIAKSSTPASTSSVAKKGYTGVILCASYPTVDLSDTDLRLLSIYGSNDKVLDMEQYEASKKLWPIDSEECVIQGGIHSYFGSYGIQDKDGVPEITNYEQITQTADIIADWVSQ